MAVIKGIHVSVQADGEPLEERQDTSIVENDVSEMTRYIEAKSGQPFEIHMLTPQEDQFEGNIIAQDIYVDNKLIETVLHQKGSPLDKEVCKGLTLPGGIRFFRFSDVAIGKCISVSSHRLNCANNRQRSTTRAPERRKTPRSTKMSARSKS